MLVPARLAVPAALSMVGGYVDVICFVRYSTFVATMTGNLVITGQTAFEVMHTFMKTDEMRLSPEPGDAKGLGPVVGARGSYDQSLSNGLVCGARVFVCDNLAFSGEAFKTMRKNTTYVHRDWREMVVEHLSNLLGHYQAVAARAEAMRSYLLERLAELPGMAPAQAKYSARARA